VNSLPKTFHQGLNFVKQIGPINGNEAAPEVLGVLAPNLDTIELMRCQVSA
jgi:hypothetical protein